MISFAVARAEEASIDQIVKERDTLLAKIHEATKNNLAVGAASAEQVRSAAIDLYSFRRDSASALSGRLQWQGMIVTAEKERSTSVEKEVKQGLAPPIEALRARERVLAAEQKLLELKAAQ